MNRINWKSVLPPIVLLLLATPLRSQNAPPHLGFAYPAGGRQGTTVEVKLGGQYLDGASNVHISGDGIRVKVLGHTRPLNQREIGALRKELQDLEKKETKTAEDRKQMMAIRKKLAPPAVRPTPVLAEIVTLEITVDSKASPGPRQLRLEANTGMSNPVAFYVGKLPEVSQKKDLVDPEATHPAVPDIEVTLPVALNSQIMPGTVDRYRFKALQGQQLVFNTHARDLIPYLADAVPGWFQVALTLYDTDGREVAYADHFHHHADPVLAYKVTKDGEYVLEVKDALYRGRENFVYRIEAGELPFVSSHFPLGCPARTRTTVTLHGWNLPKDNLTLEPVDLKPGLRFVSIREGELPSNGVPFAVDTLPECLSAGTNKTRETAQSITKPMIVNGTITEPGSWHVFRFEGQGGQTVIAEVRARRLGSPLDSVLKLTDSDDKVVAFNDDWEDKGQGLITHHADSFIRAKLPATGDYYLYLGDIQGQASPAHSYRLRVSVPRLDFELEATPCGINARPGSTVAMTIHAIRKDGFAGEISLSLIKSPKGFTLGGAKVPVNQDSVRVTMQVPADAPSKPVNLVVEGRASIAGDQVVHAATPAEDMMQAFAYHHLVPVNELIVAISGNARARFPAQLLDKGPIKIRPGGTAQIHIAIARPATANKIQLVLSDPPEGITVKNVVMNSDGAIVHLQADSEKVAPGLKGNLIIEAYPEGAGKAGAGRAGFPLGTLPAIPFEVLTAGR